MKIRTFSLVLLLALVALLGSTFTAAANNVVSLADFGAVGDGKTDSTLALNLAVMQAGPGGAVHIPAGRYYISGVVTLMESIEIYGDGNEVSVLVSDGGSNRTGFVLMQGNTTIRDLGFENMGEPIAFENREGHQFENVRIERNRFVNGKSFDRNRGVIGLTSGKSRQRPYPIVGLVIRENTFINTEVDAINLRVVLVNAQVEDNRIIDSPKGSYAIRLGDSPDEYPGQHSNRVVGNVIEHTSSIDIYEGDPPIILVYGENHVIENNVGAQLNLVGPKN